MVREGLGRVVLNVVVWEVVYKTVQVACNVWHPKKVGIVPFGNRDRILEYMTASFTYKDKQPFGLFLLVYKP